jgi:hypothetical protein
VAIVDLPSPGGHPSLRDPLVPLPRRDARGRAELAAVARRVAPVAAAADPARVLPVAGDLGRLLPGGGLRWGGVVRARGACGAGVTSLVGRLVAAATRAGEWAAVVDLGGTFGGLAALEAGIVPERFALVRGVSRPRWATTVGALLEGVACVAAVVPAGVRAAEARRLAARAREQGAVLVAVESVGVASRQVGSWPGEAVLCIDALRSTWPRGCARGFLDEPVVQVEVSGRGAAHRPRRLALAAAG